MKTNDDHDMVPYLLHLLSYIELGNKLNARTLALANNIEMMKKLAAIDKKEEGNDKKEEGNDKQEEDYDKNDDLRESIKKIIGSNDEHNIIPEKPKLKESNPNDEDDQKNGMKNYFRKNYIKKNLIQFLYI